MCKYLLNEWRQNGKKCRSSLIVCIFADNSISRSRVYLLFFFLCWRNFIRWLIQIRHSTETMLKPSIFIIFRNKVRKKQLFLRVSVSKNHFICHLGPLKMEPHVSVIYRFSDSFYAFLCLWSKWFMLYHPGICILCVTKDNVLHTHTVVQWVEYMCMISFSKWSFAKIKTK